MADDIAPLRSPNLTPSPLKYRQSTFEEWIRNKWIFDEKLCLRRESTFDTGSWMIITFIFHTSVMSVMSSGSLSHFLDMKYIWLSNIVDKMYSAAAIFIIKQDLNTSFPARKQITGNAYGFKMHQQRKCIYQLYRIPTSHLQLSWSDRKRCIAIRIQTFEKLGFLNRTSYAQLTWPFVETQQIVKQEVQ